MSVKGTERLLNVFIFLALLALVFVVGYPQYQARQPSRITIGVDQSLASIPFYVAQYDTSRQYFAIEKVIPEIVEISGDALAGVKNGTYDIGVVPWHSLVISPAINGDTVKAFGSIELRGITDAVIVSRTSKFKGLKDLKGKRLGYQEEYTWLVDLLIPRLVAEGLDKVTTVALTGSEVPTALASNQVDALFVLEPMRGYLLFQGDTTLTDGLIARYLMPNMPLYAIVMRKNYLKEKGMAGARIKNVLDGVFGYSKAHPEVVKNTLLRLRNWPQDSTGMLLAMGIRLPEYQRIAEIDVKGIERFQSLLVQAGIGTCGVKPSEFLFQRTDFRQ